MKGSAKVIDALNRALTIELTAINQYFIHAKMCRNWGYMKLAAKQHQESVEEMKHADALIDRILFLEGAPNIAKYDLIRAGSDVKNQLEADLKLELGGVAHYREAVALCLKEGDAASRDLLERILVESEEHVDWLETQLGLIAKVGLQNYLSEQMGGDSK